MEIEYEKVKMIVFTENQKEKRKYFNLFTLMMKDKITKQVCGKDIMQFETDKFSFKFFIKTMNSRGCKAHYVLNLTQDAEFENYVALPVAAIHDYLKRDDKWSELFEGLA